MHARCHFMSPPPWSRLRWALLLVPLVPSKIGIEAPTQGRARRYAEGGNPQWRKTRLLPRMPRGTYTPSHAHVSSERHETKKEEGVGSHPAWLLHTPRARRVAGSRTDVKFRNFLLGPGFRGRVSGAAFGSLVGVNGGLAIICETRSVLWYVPCVCSLVRFPLSSPDGGTFAPSLDHAPFSPSYEGISPLSTNPRAFDIGA